MKNLRVKLFLLLLLGAASTSGFGQAVSFVEIVHNCAAPPYDTLDIYYNGTILDSNFLFHTALSAYQFSDSAVSITIANKHSTGVQDSIKSFSLTPFNPGQRYVIMISGVPNTGYEPNPDGRDISLDLKVITPLDSLGPSLTSMEVKFFNGVTDLPGVRLIERTTRQQFVDSAAYGDVTGYFDIDSGRYEFQLLSADSTQNYGTYIANLDGLDGQSIIIFTGGFLNVAANDSGPPLGLFGIIGGNLTQFPLEPAAFQLMHNSADTALDSVDVYINGALQYQSLPFQTSTPALLERAYAPYDIGIAHKNSTSVNDTFWHQQFVFGLDTFYIAVMNGLLNPGAYAPNPDGISTAFNVLLKAPAELSGGSSFNFDFYMVNGVTDAPALNLQPQGGPAIITNIHYDAQSNYVSIPAEFLTLSLTDTLGNWYGGYFANLPAFQGLSGVLLVSGFLNPSANANGPSAGLFLSPVEGGPFIPLFQSLTAIKDVSNAGGLGVFPNPASDKLFVKLNAEKAGNTTLRVLDMNGKLVEEIHNLALPENGVFAIDVKQLNDGMYNLQVLNSAQVANCKFVVGR